MKRTVVEAAERAHTSSKELQMRHDEYQQPGGFPHSEPTHADVCDGDFHNFEDNWPDHILPCNCDHHTGLCLECKNIITYQSPERQYGHARNPDCSHRPTKNVDPERSKRING